MSEIEEAVDTLEVMADWHSLDGCEASVRLLIADWRKRGEALRPLARIDCLIDEEDANRGYAFDRWADDRVIFGVGKERVITAGDLRRARAALTQQQPPAAP